MRSYLQVTFRLGRPIAAYYYLPRRGGESSFVTRQAAQGLLVDFSETGEAIGIEITAPADVTLDAINGVLTELGHAAIKESDIAPLHAA